jgi:hypothetical protein
MNADTARADSCTLQQQLRERFVQDDGSFYFPDGRHAFRDHGRKLATDVEVADVVTTLIEVARSRGWQEIQLEGGEGFRREAWRQASLVRLSVRGYKPSAVEHAAMVRSRAALEAHGASPEPAAPAEETGAADSAGEPKFVRIEGEVRGPTEEFIFGTLLAHGLDRYKFEPRGEMSYFVRLDTADGRRTFWEKDLQRAIATSATQPKIGDEVALWDRFGKSAPRESDGEPGRWWVEQRAFFEVRAKAARTLRDPCITPQEGVRRCPALTGAYLSLRAAELVGARECPELQKRFVEAVRERLADSIARGDPFPKAPLRQRSEGQPDLTRHRPALNR